MKPQAKKTITRKNWMPWGAMILVVSLMSFSGCGERQRHPEGRQGGHCAGRSAPEWVGQKAATAARIISESARAAKLQSAVGLPGRREEECLE
jgi:hypothetical protein